LLVPFARPVLVVDDDDDDKLRPPKVLLFIPQLIYEHGESCRNDIDRRKLRIRHQISMAILPQSHLVAKQEELLRT
jgi:hypothetical protein